MYGTVIDSGKLQETVHKPPHLMGHGVDIFGELLLLCLIQIPGFKHFRIRQYDSEGSFKLMRSIGNKLSLLYPGILHRLNCPSGEEDCYNKEYQEA